MKVKLAIAILLWAPVAWGQGCLPGNTPTVAVTNVQALQPSEAAARGVMTATLAVQAEASGAVLSHRVVLTATPTATTPYDLYFSSNNGASARLYLTTTSHPTPTDMGSVPLNGRWNGWTSSSPDVYTFTLVVTSSNGSTTQDQAKVTIWSGTSVGIVMQDKIGSNAYAAVTTTYSGTPQILFSDCPHMAQAHHTPHATLQLQNVTSGEVHNTVSADGTTVPANTDVFATVTDYISVGPDDSITGSFGGSMWCDQVGANVWESLISFRIEYARVVVKDLGHPPRPGSEKPIPSVIYDVATICDNNSDPCDWQPTVVHSWSSRHPYWWGVTSLFRAPDLSGVPWIPVASYLSDIDGFVSPSGGPWALAELVAIGGAVPYPANIGPDFPVPGKCTQYPKNVLMTLGSADIPWWPWSN